VPVEVTEKALEQAGAVEPGGGTVSGATAAAQKFVLRQLEENYDARVNKNRDEIRLFTGSGKVPERIERALRSGLISFYPVLVIIVSLSTPGRDYTTT